MKRKVLFAFVSFVFLFAFVFVLTSCNKTTEPTENSGTTNVTPTTPTNPDDPGKTDPTNPDNPDNPGTDDNVFYTITFKDYDGTVLQTSSVKKGETPAYNKSNPSRENDDNYSYTFSGWQPTLTKVSEDAIYTATYTSQSLYSITIDLDGGTSSATKLQFKTDKISKDMLPFDVKKSGYVFKGYSLNDVKVYDENGNAVSNYQPSANMTFKAIYEESVTLTVFYTLYNPKTNQLTQTFNEKPTDLGNVSETRSYNYNTYVDLFASANEGYTFVGWYNEGQLLSNDKDFKYMMWDEDFTIEARFEYTLYDLTVWSNNTDLGQVIIRNGNSQIFYNEETLPEHYTEEVTIVAYSKKDTRFLGWYNEKNELVSSNAAYTFDMLNRDYTLEAKWNSFDITYDLDGGVNNSNNPTNYNVDTQNITLLAPTKEDYTFQGWEYKGNVITEINTANICHMNLKALWTYYTLTTNVNNSKAGTVSSYNNTKVTKDQSVTIKAETNEGYTFIGWYNGNDLLTEELSYTFTMPAENLVYTAKFSANTNTTYKVEHYLQNIDNDNYTLYETDNLTGTTDTQTSGAVKMYEGFTSPSITQVNISGNGQTVIVLNYTRNSYTVELSKNIDKAGTIITGAGTYKYGKEVTIKAETNEGYTFIGWYNGDNELTKELSYTFTMLAENLVYTAKWMANTNTPYKVEHYLQNIDNDNYTLYETDNLTGTTDTQTSGAVKMYEGFTSPSITQVNINGNGQTVIVLNYTRNSYTVELSKSIDEAGTITGAGTYKYGKKVTIEATTNTGYTFIGWYDGDNEVSTDASFDYEIESSNVTFEARYTVNKYTITIDNQAAGVTIFGITSGNPYEYDSQITLTATNIPSGCSIIWTRSDDEVKVGDTYTFKVPAGNLIITIITVATASIYTREGNKIYFGTYPQTKVTATTENGLSSITFDSSTWTSYRYYISSSQSDFMYYKDVDIDHNGTYDYRGVYFTQYRPYIYSNSSSIDYTYQDDNGYSTNTIYWFSYDPIEWDILTESSGKAFIIANLILDSQDYYPNSSTQSFIHNGDTGYANNYELSAIRKFLNDNFYNTAFNELQKVFIETTTVDNSAATTANNANSYACNNTNDKMFLLSYKEANTYYTDSTARQAKGSDYAKCQGLEVDGSNSYWWLRSPHRVNANFALDVSDDGNITGLEVSCTNYGVRPACWINL